MRTLGVGFKKKNEGRKIEGEDVWGSFKPFFCLVTTHRHQLYGYPYSWALLYEQVWERD